MKSYLCLCRYTSKVSSAWTKAWTGTWPSTAPIMTFEGRFLAIFEFLGGLVISIARQLCPSTAMSHLAALVCIQTSILALGSRFGLVSGPQYRILWLSGVAILAIFESRRIWKNCRSAVLPNAQVLRVMNLSKDKLFLFCDKFSSRAHHEARQSTVLSSKRQFWAAHGR